MKTADVFFEKEPIGQLHYNGGLIEFTYEKSWNRFSISHSLPLDGHFSKELSHRFFANLLPEGNIRDMVCRKLHISADNDWELLLCLGRESAGALTILDSPLTEEQGYEKLTDQLLNHFSQSKSVLPQIISEEATRLSLAGAQDKMAVYYDGKDYFLPRHGSPTNTILKFDNQDYRQITVNEVFITQLAANVGLPTTKTWLYTKSSRPIAVFERYDRFTKDGGLHRIHQEDLCQALGRSNKTKYQKEGGPSFQEALGVVLDISSETTKDRQRLIQWQIFNILCGNSDGHGKNISFFRTQDKVTLTPFYDLVCTRVFSTLDRKMAMQFGGTYDPDLLNRSKLESWSEEIGITKRYLSSEISTMINTLEDQLVETEKQFIDQYGSFGLLEQIRLFIRKQIKKIAREIQ